MRTTIDLPDSLIKRAKRRIHKQNLTFRALVISALEQALSEDTKAFELRDAAVGSSGSRTVSTDDINQALDDQRAIRFRS